VDDHVEAPRIWVTAKSLSPGCEASMFGGS
jgi:hypothetical protein